MSKAVIQPFEDYQKSRTIFVQTVADLANRAANIDSLKKLGVMRLLSPLLSDPVISIKQSAALAISRLAKEDIEMATAVVEDKGNILPQLLDSSDTSKYVKSAACLVIKSVAGHSTFLAEKLEEGGAIRFLVTCLKEYDPTLKHASITALGEISRHNTHLARRVCEEPQSIDFLVTCSQEPEIFLKRAAVQTLCKIVRHSEDLTSKVINVQDTLNILTSQLSLSDTLLKRQILLCLSFIAKHSSTAAVQINNHDNFKEIENCIKINPDPTVQKNALVLLNELAKKKNEAPMSISGKIKPRVFVNYLRDNRGEPRLFCIPIISTIAGHSKDLAETIFLEGGLEPLIDAIDNESNHNIVSLACQAVGNLAKHSPELTNRLVTDEQNDKRFYNKLPEKLLRKAIDYSLPSDLRENAKLALENLIDKCSELEVLATLLEPPNKISIDKTTYTYILCRVIRKQREILAEHKDLRKEFFKKKTLKKIIDLKKTYEGIKSEYDQFGEFYSRDMLNFFSEDYEQYLIEKNFPG
jgi:hypothetical protein